MDPTRILIIDDELAARIPGFGEAGLTRSGRIIFATEKNIQQ